MLRNPVYIIVFRDMVSIANRNKLSVNINVLQNLDTILNEYRLLLKFIKKQTKPCLLLSFEGALRYKSHAVEKIAKYAGVDDLERIKGAIDSINPQRVKYLDSTRTNRSIGLIEQFDTTTITGWIAYAANNDQPELELFLNDKLLASEHYDISYQADETSQSGKTRYQFRINLDSISPQTGDELRLKVIDDVIDVKNSPVRY